MTVTIDHDRLAKLLDPSVHLIAGAGKEPPNGKIELCFMQGANWAAGGDGIEDGHPCIDPLIRRFGIRLNDATRFGAWRDDLKAFTEGVLGTNEGPDLSRIRRFMLHDWTIRVMAPMALDLARRPEWAAQLRALGPITDAESAKIAREVTKVVRAAAYAADAAGAADAAYDAADAAYADADAAAHSAAYAADATADAARYAAYAAVAAADDAADAAAYAAADADADADADDDDARTAVLAEKHKIWDECLALLQRLIDAKAA